MKRTCAALVEQLNTRLVELLLSPPLGGRREGSDSGHLLVGELDHLDVLELGHACLDVVVERRVEIDEVLDVREEHVLADLATCLEVMLRHVHDTYTTVKSDVGYEKCELK